MAKTTGGLTCREHPVEQWTVTSRAPGFSTEVASVPREVCSALSNVPVFMRRGQLCFFANVVLLAVVFQLVSVNVCQSMRLLIETLSIIACRDDTLPALSLTLIHRSHLTLVLKVVFHVNPLSKREETTTCQQL